MLALRRGIVIAAGDLAALAGEPPDPGLARHSWRRADADLLGYSRSGLPARTMGRTNEEDLGFFAAAVAAGAALAASAAP